MSETVSYASAGVNIEAGNEAVRRIKKAVESTFTPSVLTSIGAFGSLYDLKPLMQAYQHPVLVQSIDGVGTKMMVAKRMEKFDTIGIDLVSATTNDIIVMGAKPLTLLDYIANDRLNPAIVETIVAGMAEACRENGIALVGGETAEMPGTYLPGEHDLVGVITGVVEKDNIISGKAIQPGDAVLAFASSGLHTNGYSLARKLFFDIAKLNVHSHHDELGMTVGEALLTPHINYTNPILHCLSRGVAIKGMAHITGGGVLENIPRVLPANCGVVIHKEKCPNLPIFSVLRELGKLNDDEAYRVFNNGVGLVMIVDPAEITKMEDSLKAYPAFRLYQIGEVVLSTHSVRLI